MHKISKGVARIFHWGEPKPKAESGGGFLGKGSKCNPLSHQLGGLRSAVSSHSRVRGEAFTISALMDGLSGHYNNIVNCGLSRSHWGEARPPWLHCYAPENSGRHIVESRKIN